MKNMTLVYLMLFSITSFGQSQDGINYKALIKDNLGAVIASQNIDVRFTIIEDTGSTNVYIETHTSVTTDDSGIVILSIGDGSDITGIFNDIAWGSDSHSLKVEIDIEQDGSFVDMGTSGFKAVPYALYAKTVAEMVDADGDTKVQVEESADEDIIRLDAGGTQIVQMSKNANGDFVMNTNTSNVLIGSGVGTANTGDSNVFIGRDAARVNASGRRNVVMGSQAGYTLEDGELNVYVGTIAGRDNVSGSRNTAIGDSAGSGSSGNSNTSVGTAAGATAAGSNNILIGDSSGANNAAGNTNIMIGVGAGITSSGSNNVFIGYFAASSEAGSNKLFIENSGAATPLIYGEFDNDIVKVNGTLEATGIMYPSAGIRFPNSFAPDPTYVGNTGNSISFAHSGTSEDFLGYANNNFYFRDSPGGGDSAQPRVYAGDFTTYSSLRWKHNVNNLVNALTVVKQLQGVTYILNDDKEGETDFGFIAEEVHKILPQIAPKNENGEVDGVAYGKITPYLVEAIKEQQVIIEAQNIEIKNLKDQIETVLQRIDVVEGKN